MNNSLIEKPPFPGASTAKVAPRWELRRGIDTASTHSAARQHRTILPVDSHADNGAVAGRPPWQENGDDRPQKWAVLRRRKAGQLARDVDGLEQFSDREDFTAYTFPVFQQLKALLADLDQAGQEGNTREILRAIRNTFLDNGWEQYRREEVRRSVAAVLDKLAVADGVVARDVREAFEQLTRRGLNAVGPTLPAFDEEDEQQDVEEEEAVSG